MEPELNGQIPSNRGGGINWTGVLIIIAIIAIMAAIAIPNFLPPHGHPKYLEAKSNLAAIHTARASYFAEHNIYGSSFIEINWQAEGKNRYTYSMGSDQITSRTDNNLGDMCGLGAFPAAAGVTANGFIVHASGNIDSDPYIDVWLIDKNKNLIHVCDDVNN